MGKQMGIVMINISYRILGVGFAKEMDTNAWIPVMVGRSRGTAVMSRRSWSYVFWAFNEFYAIKLRCMDVVSLCIPACTVR
jgi:hypothetical protein